MAEIHFAQRDLTGEERLSDFAGPPRGLTSPGLLPSVQ
jgi:hypothetical protein